MLFFPFKVDLNFNRIPYLTIFVCLLCVLVYLRQGATFETIQESAQQYCHQDHDRMFWLVVDKVYGEKTAEACADIIYLIHTSKKPSKEIYDLAEKAEVFDSRTEASSRAIIYNVLEEKYNEYKQSGVSRDLTSMLMYEPQSYHLGNMITAAFAHGSWDHLLGNLFFFFAFAASVEMILGMLRYALIFLALCIGTHLSYSLAMMNVTDALPTLGLSGVVMGMIGMFVFLMPRVNIRCFLWFFVIVRIVSVPAWLLAAWYVSWDMYQLYHSDLRSGINFVAHVSGFTIGFLLGMLFFMQRKQEIKQEIRAHQLAEENEQVSG